MCKHILNASFLMLYRLIEQYTSNDNPDFDRSNVVENVEKK
jgi:hypothetical protein